LFEKILKRIRLHFNCYVYNIIGKYHPIKTDCAYPDVFKAHVVDVATATLSSNNGTSQCLSPLDEPVITSIIPAPPFVVPTANPIPKHDLVPMEVAISKIDNFVLTFLYPEQHPSSVSMC
jgi:hypothetical protein